MEPPSSDSEPPPMPDTEPPPMPDTDSGDDETPPEVLLAQERVRLARGVGRARPQLL